ncbi:MAG: helix-turn-helix transcriptional regulator [Bacteroidales bacterium]|nr:helix-turn-helix transcriptional regulator [Bacteroidales bacterium]
METKKLKVKAFIERGANGKYGVYLDHDETRLNYGIFGEGSSAEEAINDFYGCYEDIKMSLREDGKSFFEVDFDIQYDVASFLNYYSKILTLSGLEKVTGINQRQLGHYVQGRTLPRPETVKKIETSLHALSVELGQVRFCV